jgi:uncharacterized membrane protein YcaP (DUF421 family)
MIDAPIDWGEVFALDVPILEIVVRGSVMYLVVFLFLRATFRRSAGELAMLDFVFILLVAVGAEHAMLGEMTSIAGGVVLVATLVAWNYALNYLSYHVPIFERLTSPPPLPVVRDGKLLRRNMRREFLTEEELMGHLREEGIEDVAQVKSAHIEGDGKISVVPRDDK